MPSARGKSAANTMPPFKRRSHLFARIGLHGLLGLNLLAGVGISSAQAEALSLPLECRQSGGAASGPLRPDAAFAWHAQAVPPAPYPVAVRRIAVWGDSLTAARVFIDAALDRAGLAKRTILPSFIPAGIETPGMQLPLKSACAGNNWQVAYAHKDKSGRSAFSRGFTSMASDTPGDGMSLDFRFPHATTRVRELTLFYDKPAPDSSLLLGIAVDGGEERLVPLSRRPGGALQIRPDAPLATLTLRLVSGSIRVHGFAPLYQQTPDLILDVFSIPGGMLRAWSNAGDAAYSAGPAPDYDLVLVQYGTNEGADPHFSRDAYLAYLRANLARMRHFNPRARCVLIGPPDRGDVAGTGMFASLKYSNVHRQIALAQKQVGAEFRCAFWDWQAAMGGPGSAVRWARMKPPRMQPDLTHMTAIGYRISGRLFAESIPLTTN